MIGKELGLTPGIGKLEKFYIWLLGVPISGLRIRLRRVLPQLTGNPRRVLDAGCGRGVLSYEAAKRFNTAEVVAVDIDEEQLQKNKAVANQAGLDNLKFVAEDIANLQFNNEFDLAISVDNLEHLQDDHAGIRSLNRALAMNGKLVLHVPGYQRRWFWFKFTTNFDVPGHFRPGYFKDEITEKLQQHGFDIDYSQYTFGWLETVSNNISYFITKAEAKNKLIYALVFPVLNVLAYLGRNAKPDNGAGVLVLARKVKELDA
ncbi:MAG: methyltransferase domain-containing protein [Alteromonadaceae bacterium]|nr:methyltransferase domain-containing protein [Alteromonadaceae bacterium]